jgi:hypothetical protein
MGATTALLLLIVLVLIVLLAIFWGWRDEETNPQPDTTYVAPLGGDIVIKQGGSVLARFNSTRTVLQEERYSYKLTGATSTDDVIALTVKGTQPPDASSIVLPNRRVFLMQAKVLGSLNGGVDSYVRTTEVVFSLHGDSYDFDSELNDQIIVNKRRGEWDSFFLLSGNSVTIQVRGVVDLPADWICYVDLVGLS